MGVKQLLIPHWNARLLKDISLQSKKIYISSNSSKMQYNLIQNAIQSEADLREINSNSTKTAKGSMHTYLYFSSRYRKNYIFIV